MAWCITADDLKACTHHHPPSQPGARARAAASGNTAPPRRPGDLRCEKGGDVYTVAGLEFAQAVTGMEKVLTLQSWGVCSDCKVRGLLCLGGKGRGCACMETRLG